MKSLTSLILLTLGLILSSCAGGPSPKDRAGPWSLSRKDMVLAFTVNSEGTAITEFKIEKMFCVVSGTGSSVRLEETTYLDPAYLTINANGEFDNGSSNTNLIFKGRFHEDGKHVSGTYKVGWCSGYWDISRE